MAAIGLLRGLRVALVAAALALPAARAAASDGGAPTPIHRVDNGDRAVAITFDACATRTHGYGFDRKVYEILKEGAVPATIFVSGRWVELHPSEMEELAHDPLISFGDHSYDHPHMPRLSSAGIEREIDQTEAALARYGKRSVAFRPPFGEWSRHLIAVVNGRGLPTVTWDVVSGDPSKRTTKDAMIRNVVRRARAGSIVIFHINGRGLRTAEALPEILSALRGEGLRFVSLAELLARTPGAAAAAALVPAAAAAAEAPAPAAVPEAPWPPEGPPAVPEQAASPAAEGSPQLPEPPEPHRGGDR
jgi:peptidoglycan/xylan/chitin deacetylase (PgdA/CDA1 family)